MLTSEGRVFFLDDSAVAQGGWGGFFCAETAGGVADALPPTIFEAMQNSPLT